MNLPTEHAEHVTFLQEFERRWPGLWIFAIPNGGHRHKTTAAKMKLEGVKKGVPDLYIPAIRTWVEMKRQKGGRLSPEQKDWMGYLIKCGDCHIVAKGWEDGIKQVELIANDYYERYGL